MVYLFKDMLAEAVTGFVAVEEDNTAAFPIMLRLPHVVVLLEQQNIW